MKNLLNYIFSGALDVVGSVLSNLMGRRLFEPSPAELEEARQEEASLVDGQLQALERRAEARRESSIAPTKNGHFRTDPPSQDNIVMHNF